MFRDFAYIDDEKLDAYISQAEDGLRVSVNRAESVGDEKSVKAGVSVLSGAGSRTSGEATQSEFSDTSSAKFERLMALIAADEQEANYLEILQPTDVENVRAGHLVDLQADLYEADFTKAVGSSGLLSVLPLLQQLMAAGGHPALEALPQDQLQMMTAIGGLVGENRTILGEIDGTDWHLAAQLKKPLRSDAEGFFRVIGKVVRVSKDRARPIPGMPLIEQMPRQQRRDWERKGPSKPGDPLWVEAPMLEIDVLAIYS